MQYWWVVIKQEIIVKKLIQNTFELRANLSCEKKFEKCLKIIFSTNSDLIIYIFQFIFSFQSFQMIVGKHHLQKLIFVYSFIQINILEEILECNWRVWNVICEFCERLHFICIAWLKYTKTTRGATWRLTRIILEFRIKHYLGLVTCKVNNCS